MARVTAPPSGQTHGRESPHHLFSCDSAIELFQCLGFRVSGFEDGVSGFGVQISGFGFRASGFRFRVSCLVFGVLCFGVWVSGFGFRDLGFGPRASGFWFRGLGFGFWVSGFRFRVSGLGFRVPSFGFRVLEDMWNTHSSHSVRSNPPICRARALCRPKVDVFPRGIKMSNEERSARKAGVLVLIKFN